MKYPNTIHRFWIRIISIILIITLTVAGCTYEHNQTSQKQLFDLNWKFTCNDIPSAVESDFNDSEWNTIDLPHRWTLSSDTSLKNTTLVETSPPIQQTCWYRKTFTIPYDWKNKTITLLFEEVILSAEIFINEYSLGTVPDTSATCNFNLTPHLFYDKENTIAVRVRTTFNRNQENTLTTGIDKHVWLIITDPVFSGI